MRFGSLVTFAFINVHFVFFLFHMLKEFAQFSYDRCSWLSWNCNREFRSRAMKSLFSLVFVMLCVLRIAFAQVESRDPKTDLPGGSTKVQKVPDDQEISQEISQEIPNTQEMKIPITPAAVALKKIQLPPGFKATLFASEPDVHQPIFATTDARGRLWVVECYTYSDRKENFNTQLNDRIVIFEDTDNDGVFDSRKIFWDQGKKLTSAEVGLGGVWVTAAPNFMFIPDRNQDDVPDGEPEILLDGFEDSVIRHNIVNGLRWGPDGWLYGRHGIQGNSFVGAPGATESQRTPMNCAIWRYHPTNHKFEIVAQGGTNPWGFDFDQHGEMFMINTVIGHLFHVVPNARFRRMYGSHFNPHMYSVIEQTADHYHWDSNHENWHATKRKGLSDRTDAAGGGHAHTGLMIYQGDNWPAEFRNKLFTANFHGRRINSESIEREGNSYIARHAPDYFKTADPWFRGIELVYGPDGGVFLLDWSDIGECHENDGIHRTSGRIYKLTYNEPKLGEPAPAKYPDLRKLSDDQLIDLMDHENRWYSRKARRLLQERSLENAASIVSALAETYAKIDSQSGAEQTNALVTHKLRVMWALYSASQQSPADWLLERTLDPSEHVRAWAVRLLADGLEEPNASVSKRFVELAGADPSGLVRLYVASSLPRFKLDDAIEIASKLAGHASDSKDRVQPKLIWYGLESFVGSCAKHGGAEVDARVNRLLELASNSKLPTLRRNIVRRLTSEIDQPDNHVDKIVDWLNDVADPDQARDIVEAMSTALDGWSQAELPAKWGQAAEKLLAYEDPGIDDAVLQLNVVFGDGRTSQELAKIVGNDEVDFATRRKAISTLVKSMEAGKVFEFLKPHLNNKGLVNVAASALVHSDDEKAGAMLLRRFGQLDPAGKVIAINTVTTRPAWASSLLNLVADGKIDKSFVSAAHARQILNMGDQELTKKLSSVWGEVRQTTAQRQKEIEEFQVMLTGDEFEPDLKNGQALYVKNCANCHTLFGSGGKIGPDLTGADRRNLYYLLENVLDPSASVAESFRTSIIQLDDGRVLTGVVVSENERVMRLQTQDDLLAIDLKTVEQRKLTKKSLMPEGLLNGLSKQQVVDLFGFLAK